MTKIHVPDPSLGATAGLEQHPRKPRCRSCGRRVSLPPCGSCTAKGKA